MAELYTLPDGWEWKKLGDVTKFKQGSQIPINEQSTIYENGADRFIRIVDYTQNTDDIRYIKHNPKNTFVSSDEVIMVRYGNVGFVGRGIDGVLANNMFKVIPNGDYLSNDYIYKFLNSNIVQNIIVQSNNSSTMSAINFKLVSTIPFVLPPLEEQKRIVAKLDNLFAKIDKAIALHQKNIDEADIFMASVLNDVFGELEEKYNKEKFDEIKTSNVIGLVRSVKEQSPSLQYQYVKMNNITNNNRFTFDNIINVDATDEEVRKFNLEKGDFLFNTRNSAELVGKSCIFDYDMKNILYNNNIMRVRFRDDISSYFVSYQFGCNYLKEQLENIKSATTNVAAIYYKTLKEIDVVIPPLQIQQKVVSYLDEISQKMEKIKQIQKEKMQSLKELKASILDKAFKGEL